MLKLHGYWRSTAAYRVRIGLHLKGIAYEQVNHDLRTGAQRDPAYLEVAPHGLVPALATPKGTIIESLAILEWLEEQSPVSPLLPFDAHDRAVVRSMAALVACDIHPLNNLRVLNALRSRFGAEQPALDAWLAHWVGQGFAALETLVAAHGRGFAFGSEPTLADCCLVPQVYSAERFKVPLAPYPHILKAVANARALPAFQSAHPDVQPDADPA